MTSRLLTRSAMWLCFLTACTRHEASGYDNGRDDQDPRAGANSFLASRRPVYEAACKNGETPSCEVLGDFYHWGVAGTPVDEPRSKAFYHRACAGGSATACKKEIDPDWLAKSLRPGARPDGGLR